MKLLPLSLSILLLIAGNALAQPATVVLRQFAQPQKDWADTLNIPQVTLATKAATERANYYILASMFDEIVPESALKKFAVEWEAWMYVKQGFYQRSVSYEVVRNDGVLLSFLFHMSGNTNPGDWDRSLTLDAATGLPVRGRDLFRADRIGHVEQLALAARMKLVALDSIAMARDTEVNMPLDERLGYQQALRDCANQINFESVFVSETEFSPSESYCYFDASRITPIDWTIRIPISAMEQDLSEYGRAVLIDKKQHAFSLSDSSALVLMHGALGKKPITMMLHRVDTLQTAYFFVDGKSTVTELSGRFDGSNVRMQDQVYKQPQEFEGTLLNGVFTGICRKGKKTIPFVLHSF